MSVVNCLICGKSIDTDYDIEEINEIDVCRDCCKSQDESAELHTPGNESAWISKPRHMKGED